MNPSLRRILLIVSFAIVVIGLGYAIYLVFFKPGPVVTVNNGAQNVNGLPTLGNGNINGVVQGNINGLPIVNALQGTTGPTQIAQGGPTLTTTVVDHTSQGLTVSGDGNLLYYDRTQGQFYKLSADGAIKELLTNDIYKDVQNITWAPDGQKAILTFPDNSKILYNFNGKKQTTLPKELNDFSWSPRSDQIVSKFLDGQNPDNQWLMVSKPDGSQSSTAEHLGENAGDVIPLWSPNNQIIATYQNSIDATHTEIIFLGAQGENFKSATVDGRGFTPKWTPDGRRMLYSAYGPDTQDNPHLFMMNASPDTIGTGNIDLGLDTTADKCTFSASGLSIYCAVPYYLNPGSGPQPILSADVPDNIYQIDLVRGSTNLVARPVDSHLNQRYNATNLQLTPNEDALFFTDALTGTIQKIQLR